MLTISESEMLRELMGLYMELKIPGMASPDYRATKIYSPQWKVLGSVYYYQLPASANNLIVAKIHSRSGKAEFNRNGIKL